MALRWYAFALSLVYVALAQDVCNMPDESSATSLAMNISRSAEMNCPSHVCPCPNGCGFGCCPKIVTASCKVPVNQASVIEAYSGYRANAAIIIDWGNCAAKNPGGFYWWVDWGDGSRSYNCSDTLGPYQEVHTYHTCQRFLVSTSYCAVPPPGKQVCCDYYHKWIVPHA
ncbi:uncharacterized protein [Oscarella lobularis]|uniref:uncharacterized protein n=1 Tax=Oscarella lobularis TaxID=121494 RepID=UPI00331346BA